ncbi:MAG: hypothetical protein JSS78_03800 [Bacteroidetes bacterium]|nr:hypothetical protein [Bacteroidota bacterium]
MNLFVGNLSPEVTEQTLRNAFSEFGVITSLKIIIDPQTGMPKGFGFVEFEDRRSGYEAITNLDMTYLEGTVISVKEAKNSKQQSGGNSYGAGKPFQKRPGGFNNNRQGNSNFRERRDNFNSDRPTYQRKPDQETNFNSIRYNKGDSDANLSY